MASSTTSWRRTWLNIFWLGTKELRSVLSDPMMVVLILWAFTFSIYSQANATGNSLNNAAIAIVDEDQSTLSRAIVGAFYPPYFKTPQEIAASQIDDGMDRGAYGFVVVIPPEFEADVRRGAQVSIQVNIDATVVAQAGLGASYIQSIAMNEIRRFAARTDTYDDPQPVTVVVRRAFNPNGSDSWFKAVAALLNQISTLTIALTGAALLREREHGMIEHLMVMPLTSFQIALAKVWANGLIILVAFAISVLFVVRGILDVPIAGSPLLLLAGAAVYMVAAAAIGILLGVLARTMAQFALLLIMTIIPIMMLSGGMSPIESQPELVQRLTWFLPSRHFMTFAQAVMFRGADLSIVWSDFLKMAGLGALYFALSLALFRHSLAAQQ